MKTKNTHGMVSPLQIVNAALIRNGQRTIRGFMGSGMSAIATQIYHPTRRQLLVDLEPEFAINLSPEEIGGTHYLKSLDDGRFVYDVEDPIEFSDEFVEALIERLAKKFAIFGKMRGGRRGGFRMW